MAFQASRPPAALRTTSGSAAPLPAGSVAWSAAGWRSIAGGGSVVAETIADAGPGVSHSSRARTANS
jgi:hypothetical protein